MTLKPALSQEMATASEGCGYGDEIQNIDVIAIIPM